MERPLLLPASHPAPLPRLPTLRSDDLHGLVSHFFGDDGSRQLSLDTFRAFVAELRAELLRLEFQHYDWQNKVGMGGRGKPVPVGTAA
jgi:hypothetical protein